MNSPTPATPAAQGLSRRTLVKRGSWFAGLAAIFGFGAAAAQQVETFDGQTAADTFGAFFQKHYKTMSKEELQAAIGRIERRVRKEHGVDIKVGTEPALPDTVYGYAINLSKCKGTRRCVEACVAENNQSRDSQIQYIRVLEMDRGTMDLNRSEHYFEDEKVPKKDKFYLPIQCMQCDDAPCTKACPVQATWTEPDGITVVDYDWCIGCRYCMTACPYWARHFNWNEPKIKPEEINTDTHYLGNRPRQKGVMEKCTFCIQRTRKGRQPACLEACPTGARVFGNLLDPNSDIRYVLENKRVFRLKESLGTEPKFWYYTD